MRITFLGTSHGSPEPNRRCSSTLIEAGGQYYLVDMGTNAIECLKNLGVAPEAIRAVFITHMHGDHSNGLVSFADLCCWSYPKSDPEIHLPKPMDEIVSALKGWLACNGTNMRDFRFREVHSGVIYDDGNLRVTAYPTLHKENSHAFLLEAEGKRVLLTGDLCTTGPKDFPVQVLEKPLDLAVAEAAHFPATDYLPILQGNPNLKAFAITHYFKPRIPSVYEALDTLEKNGVKTFLATDGLEVEV